MAAVTRIETLTYNGFTWPVESKLTSQITYVTDQAQRTVTYGLHRFHASATVIAPAGFNNDLNLTDIRRALSSPGQALTFTGVGYGPMSVNAGGPKDVKWGPFPKVTSWEPLSPNAAKVEWVCEVAIPECENAPTEKQLLAYNFGIATSVDEQGYSTRTISGYLEIPMTRDPADRTKVPDTADNYWTEATCPKCPVGFRRVSEQTNISYDKRRLDFTVVDVELPPNFFPPGVTECRASHLVQASGPALVRATSTMRASYSLTKNLPKPLAFFYFIKLVNARVQAQNAGGAGGIIPTSIAIEEPDIYGRQAGNFSLSWRWFARPVAAAAGGAGGGAQPGGQGGGGGAGNNRPVRNSFLGGVAGGIADASGATAAGGFLGGVINGAAAGIGATGSGAAAGASLGFSTQGFLDQSALWRGPPDNNYDRWRQSIGFLMDRPRGYLGLRHPADQDKIISLCETANPPKVPGAFLKSPVPGTPTSILTKFPNSGSAQLASYFGLRIYTDTNQAVMKFLPTNGASSSSGSSLTVSDLFSPADDMRAVPPQGLKFSGKLQAEAGMPPDTMVTRTSPTVYAVLVFSLEQVGPVPKPPVLVSIDGMRGIQYLNGSVEIAHTGNYTLVINGRESKVTSNRMVGFQVYRILDPPANPGALEVPPNFFLQEQGNVANYFAR